MVEKNLNFENLILHLNFSKKKKIIEILNKNGMRTWEI